MEREEPSEQPCREGDTINPQNPTTDVLLNTSVNTRATMTSLQAIPSIGSMLASPMVTLATMTCDVLEASVKGMLLFRTSLSRFTTGATPTFAPLYPHPRLHVRIPSPVTLNTVYVQVNFLRAGILGEELRFHFLVNTIVTGPTIIIDLTGQTNVTANATGMSIGLLDTDLFGIEYALTSLDPDFGTGQYSLTFGYTCDA